MIILFLMKFHNQILDIFLIIDQTYFIYINMFYIIYK